MDLTDYRSSPNEQKRVASLMSLVPMRTFSVLDVGARDGYLSRQLADRSVAVTALDLAMPQIDDARIRCVKGNATALPFEDGSFDLVFCAEVLEHIPSPALEQACLDMARVCARHIIVGVPYRQDIRWGRLTCRKCGKVSPPWGHVNSFDEQRLCRLFPGFALTEKQFVGVADVPTNALSARLMDWAGNPYGPYDQEEHCIHCDSPFEPPPPRSLAQRFLARAAVVIRRALQPLYTPHGNWVHVLLTRS
ncbi:Methyltransferase family protein [Rubrivivax sp. A210]|uniref:class I SAM-dependent methyltransferase n=1 Tax=Rubrivivax sp. A210 TaxID=2772301 RepID=UPI001918E91C|nr:class I SAM-dependent methyltransferase [Rubrivivax sp. A210]CAD5375224.1 Methyltransferase family protein [Rubrivivax sp. A210]